MKAKFLNEARSWQLVAMLMFVVAAWAVAWGGDRAAVTTRYFYADVATDHGQSVVACKSTMYQTSGDSYQVITGMSATYPTFTGGPTYSGGGTVSVGLDGLGRAKFIPAQMWGTVSFRGQTTHNSRNWVTDACMANVPKRLT